MLQSPLPEINLKLSLQQPLNNSIKMKKFSFVAVICVFCMTTFSSCQNVTINKGDVMPDVTSAKIDSVSYAIGMWAANTVKMSEMGEIHYGEFTKAFMDVLNGKDTKLTEEEFMNILSQYTMERQKYVTAKRDEDNKVFFEKNKANEGIVETESGLQYKVEVEGEGLTPTMKDTVVVHYTGTLLDGTKFDSSYDRNEPLTIPLNRVIKGWSEGITYMKEGGKATLYIPSALGYGERGTQGIPGNSALIFEVELIQVNPCVEATEK